MYIPKHFNESDLETAFNFVQKHAFGQLISTVDGRLTSSHLPFLLSDDKTKIYAHLAKQNQQYLSLDQQEVLLTFEGPHDYISPSWYEGEGVPTWNYQAVHIYGRCKVLTNVDSLQTLVDSLSQKYESAFEQPWQPKYNTNMLKAIVGVEIQIDDIQCKFKLSQNKSLEDQIRIVEKLEEFGSIKLAQAMRKSMERKHLDKK